MAKKTVKESPHLRVRMDPKLLARLEGAREANGNTLTGEIVTRIEDTFRRDERVTEITAARDALAAELADVRNQLIETRTERARMEQQLKEWDERRGFASAI